MISEIKIVRTSRGILITTKRVRLGLQGLTTRIRLDRRALLGLFILLPVTSLWLGLVLALSVNRLLRILLLFLAVEGVIQADIGLDSCSELASIIRESIDHGCFGVVSLHDLLSFPLGFLLKGFVPGHFCVLDILLVDALVVDLYVLWAGSGMIAEVALEGLDLQMCLDIV